MSDAAAPGSPAPGSPAPGSPARVIALVDDDDDLRAATAQLLTLAGFAVHGYATAAAFLSAPADDPPAAVVTDIRMPGMSGIELFRAIHARDAELPVILMTGHGDIDTAVAALKAGAWDFLTKPFAPDVLVAAVTRAAAARALTLENRRLRALAEAAATDELVGHSAAIRRLRATAAMLADADPDVVVEGATGTGKRLLARLIHRSGRRARHRFVAIDCAALSAPGATALFDAYGAIARAHRGTLFLANLDRAGEPLQHRLAQFAAQRAVALDARAPEAVDTRIVAALDEARRDRVLPALYHRLAGVVLRLPALAERPGDVPLLVAHFLAAQARAHDRPAPPLTAAAHLMARRDWPGNVRELEMAVERLVLGLDDMADAAAPPPDAPLPERVRLFERAAIVEAVMRADGEVARAIAALGIPRETFYYRVKRLGIDLRRLRAGRAD